MSTILMALSFGAISMAVTFIAGLASGVVRIGTLALRSCFAFCLASAACYFLLMLFEMYDEKHQKEAEKIAAELASEGEEGETSESEGFQPTENYPNANS